MVSEIPCVEPVKGVFQIPVRSHNLLRTHRTNCFVIGEPGGDTLIVDPSPKNDDEYDKLLNTLNRLAKEHRFQYSGIFITHSHPDHHKNAAGLSNQLSLPVTISGDSYQRLKSRDKKNLLKELDIRHAKEGDTVTRWQGKDVHVYEVPGHDEGHLALAPESMEWFLAGDLVQQKGTVVITTSEGDMAKYFQTLQRIIDLKPKLVLPSHGQALKGASVLKKTLKHRKKREKQVLKLHRKGLTPQQMVEIIYRNVNKHLWPFALENVKSHLKKLSLPAIDQDPSRDR
jgi:glyoxylase-like metal-dependent hydrolase (beta-lactamase superfamily II)